VNADERHFSSYESGVLDSSKCGNDLDHAVLAVGWGKDEKTGLEYWLIKNTWNTDWGEEGYIRIAIVDGDGICGIQMEPLFPTVK